MISGRQALGSIDSTLNKAHSQIANIEDEIRQTTERLLAAKKALIEELRELARERLSRLDDGGATLEQIDQVERQALLLLQQREDALRRLHEEIENAERSHEQAEAERRHQATQLDGVVGAVDEAEAKIQARLDTDPVYRQQREDAESAERKAMHAKDKADRSADELAAKGEAYKSDPLFMYLWGRAYGLPAYRASGLIRWLDDKVARLIGYADARANFARLNEIPKRLREHADHLTALADQAFDQLKALDEAARREEGIPALEKRVDSEQQVLDQIDEKIKGHEATHQGLMSKRAEFASGDDAFTRKAIDYLAEEFQRTEIADLRRDAFATPYPEDDLIVSRMWQRESEQQEFEATLQDLRGLLEKHQQRLHELESLRVQFKRKHFDRAGSVFTNDSMIPVLLGQFLSGMLDQRMLWKVMQEHQRYRPQRSDPGFGSGGFGRGTVWKGGLGDLGDIIGGMSRGGGGFGSRGGGGFGGGGLGRGGGFRTGGGF